MADGRVSPDLAALVEAHHAVLYRYALRLTRSPADAEDLTQQTYLKAQTRIGQLRDPGAARSWLMTVLRNCYLRQHRRGSSQREKNIDLSLDCFPEDDATQSDIDREALTAALDELSEEFRMVLLLYYFEELSYREIAEQLDLPSGTVMSRLSRAKSHLRRRLQAKGVASYGPHNHGWSREPT